MFDGIEEIVKGRLSERWKDLKFMVFDIPFHPGVFEERLSLLNEHIVHCKYASVVTQIACRNMTHLNVKTCVKVLIK